MITTGVKRTLSLSDAVFLVSTAFRPSFSGLEVDSEQLLDAWAPWSAGEVRDGLPKALDQQQVEAGSQGPTAEGAVGQLQGIYNLQDALVPSNPSFLVPSGER